MAGNMSVTEHDIGYILTALAVLLLAAGLFGRVSVSIRQPALIGEVLAGVCLGPFALGVVAPAWRALMERSSVAAALDFVHWLGLILLMFISGSEMRNWLARGDRRPIVWLLGLGTAVPFVVVLALGYAGRLPLEALTGSAGNEVAVLLVLAVAVAVTSIPVVARLFHDLNILKTRFASLILGSAVLEDIILWGILAMATGLVATSSVSTDSLMATWLARIAITTMYIGVCLAIMPTMLCRMQDWWQRVTADRSVAPCLMLTLFVYIATAAMLGVSVVFAAFLAGYGVAMSAKTSEQPRVHESLRVLADVSYVVFIPMYFGTVGYRLLLGPAFSWRILLGFFIGSSVLSAIARGLAAFCAGFRGSDILNLVITLNARGGPGIVLGSVAYSAGIINGAFYTALVVTALVTSQLAGVWLAFVLSQHWPLLRNETQLATRDQVVEVRLSHVT
jgi:Kef-type K+ transport system membrane component KefB